MNEPTKIKYGRYRLTDGVDDKDLLDWLKGNTEVILSAVSGNMCATIHIADSDGPGLFIPYFEFELAFELVEMDEGRKAKTMREQQGKAGPEKVMVGQRAFILWPGLDPYSIYKHGYEFDGFEKTAEIVEVVVCQRSHKAGYISKTTGRSFYQYNVAFVSPNVQARLCDWPGGDWDKPFEWTDPVATSRNCLMEMAIAEVRPLRDGFARMRQKLEEMLPAEPGR